MNDKVKELDAAYEHCEQICLEVEAGLKKSGLREQAFGAGDCAANIRLHSPPMGRALRATESEAEREQVKEACAKVCEELRDSFLASVAEGSEAPGYEDRWLDDAASAIRALPLPPLAQEWDAREAAIEQCAKVCEKLGDEKVERWSDHPEMLEHAKWRETEAELIKARELLCRIRSSINTNGELSVLCMQDVDAFLAGSDD